MLRKLRIRMTIICMSILFVIFVGTTFAINALNYKQVNMYADNVLEILSINGGNFGDSFRPDKEPGFTPEVKYETRFFSVNFDPDGSVKMVNVKNIASVTREEAIEIIKLNLVKSLVVPRTVSLAVLLSVLPTQYKSLF